VSFFKYCVVQVFEPEYAFDKKLNKLLLDYKKEEEEFFLASTTKLLKDSDINPYSSYMNSIEKLQAIESKYETEYKLIFTEGSISNISFTDDRIAYFCLFNSPNGKAYNREVFIKKRLAWLLCFKDSDIKRHLEYKDDGKEINTNKCKMLFQTSTKDALENLHHWSENSSLCKNLKIKEKQIYEIENYLKNFHEHSELVFDYGDFLININNDFLENSNEVRDLLKQMG